MSDSPAPNLERSLYYGVLFMIFCYALEINMFAQTVYLHLTTSPSMARRRLPYIILGAIMLGLTSIVVFTDAVFMQFMWIDHRDFEGGPLGFLDANSSIWWQVLGTAANQLTNFIGDGLLIYRLYTIWGGNIAVLVLPGLMYLSSISMAIVALYQSAVPGSNFFKGKTVNFGVPWATLSVTINLLVTGLIAYRLLSERKELKKVVAPEVVEVYTGLIAILVESALPFSVLGIIFAITYGKNSDVGPAFLFVWATFCALSPQFIILRVTVGKAWTRDITKRRFTHIDAITESRTVILHTRTSIRKPDEIELTPIENNTNATS